MPMPPLLLRDEPARLEVPLDEPPAPTELPRELRPVLEPLLLDPFEPLHVPLLEPLLPKSRRSARVDDR